MPAEPVHDFVSRGALKLQAALSAFALDIAGLDAVDLGCSTGGFTELLLRRGARHVVCLDTAYAQLAWKLRTDERTTVLERTNALHAQPVPPAPLDLAVIDLGWTPQRLAIPAALPWLKPNARIVTLIKPHYEAKEHKRAHEIRKGVLPESIAEEITNATLNAMHTLGVRVLGCIQSPILGGGKRGKRAGNIEHLALLELDTTNQLQSPTP